MAEAKISRIASDFETQLSGAIAVGATSFTIASVTDEDGVTLSDGIYCFTIDRDSSDAKEYLVGQLTASTKTVASISSAGRQGGMTANAQRAHRIGANVIISDHSTLSAFSRIFSGVDTIPVSAPLAYTSNPTLSSAAQLATKGYVDSVVTGGTVNTDRIILGSQTAGETVAAGDIVYFKSSDSRWWKADADLTATFSNVLLGVAQGSGTAGNTITGGVLIYGKCDSFTGLTATATYYLSNTAGGVATSAGTYSVILGQAFSTTGIFFNPNTLAPIATSSGSGDAGKLVKLNSNGYLDETILRPQATPNVITVAYAASPYTWTKDTGLKFIEVELWGGGGGGGIYYATGARAGGGAGGGYVKHRIYAASLGATETVTIGGGGGAGTGNSSGGSGDNTTFGSLLTAYGGHGGDSDNALINCAQGGGFAIGSKVCDFYPEVGIDPNQVIAVGSGDSENTFPHRKNGRWGGGAGGDASDTGGSSVHGGAGGGGGNSGSGGVSIFGGNGGTGTRTGTAGAGVVPAGGGGGASGTSVQSGTAGAGAAGQAIITEYYN